MIYIPFWLSVISTFLLFISLVTFVYSTRSIKLISSWGLGFYISIFIIHIFEISNLNNHIPIANYQERYSYRYIKEDCFFWFDCEKTKYSTRTKLKLNIKEISYKSSDINLYLLFFSFIITIITINLLMKFYEISDIFRSLIVIIFSLLSFLELYSLFFSKFLYYIFFSINLGTLIGIPFYIVFFSKNER